MNWDNRTPFSPLAMLRRERDRVAGRITFKMLQRERMKIMLAAGGLCFSEDMFRVGIAFKPITDPWCETEESKAIQALLVQEIAQHMRRLGSGLVVLPRGYCKVEIMPDSVSPDIQGKA